MKIINICNFKSNVLISFHIIFFTLYVFGIIDINNFSYIFSQSLQSFLERNAVGEALQ
jgi:hypothetical protein